MGSLETLPFRDMSGELTLGDGDLVEFALALDPTDEAPAPLIHSKSPGHPMQDPEKTARGMLFAMAQGQANVRLLSQSHLDAPKVQKKSGPWQQRPCTCTYVMIIRH